MAVLNSDDGFSLQSLVTTVGSGATNAAGATSVGVAGQIPADVGAAVNSPTMQIRTNPLHNYVNWTYQIGWYMLDVNTYNSFTQNGTDTAALRNYPIFRSGGFTKSSANQYDLGLVSLHMTGTIGNNYFSPSANQFEIEMQIVEPYGASLLASLKLQAQQTTDGNEYQLPYLLEIKWIGYDDKGQIVTNIPGTGPKLITVQIVNITFNISSSGTTYTITFAPYNQMPIGPILGVIGNDIQLYGGSLKEVLVDGEKSLKATLNKIGQDDKANKKAQYPDTYDFSIVSYADSSRSSNDNKLANAPLTFPVKGGGNTTVMAQRNMGSGSSQATNDPTKQFWPFPSTSTITGIITDLAKNSKYFQDKITTTANSDKSHPMELIKVVPVVLSLGKYDTIRGVYQKNIVFKVVPFYQYGQNYPNTGQAPVESRGFMKDYNWLFTGKNQDVTNVDLQYNLQYFRVLQQAAGQKAIADTGADIDAISLDASQSGPSSNSIPVLNVSRSNVNLRTNKGPIPSAVQEYFDQQLNSPTNSDLINVDLEIIGDPDWIPQDRSIRPVGTSVDASNKGLVDGDPTKGISTDVDAVYVNLTFRTPRDYNDKTGLMDLTNDQILISGFYQVITVESIFENGRFTQRLNLVRVPNQTRNKVSATGIIAAGAGIAGGALVSSNTGPTGSTVGGVIMKGEVISKFGGLPILDLGNLLDDSA